MALYAPRVPSITAGIAAPIKGTLPGLSRNEFPLGKKLVQGGAPYAGHLDRFGNGDGELGHG